jgi:hypothetical protein
MVQKEVKMKTVRDIIIDYLKSNECDGLCHPDFHCGCGIEDILNDDCCYDYFYLWYCIPAKKTVVTEEMIENDESLREEGIEAGEVIYVSVKEDE